MKGTTNKNIDIMENEKIPKLLLKFALPTIAAMLVNAFYNAVDAMFISWLGVEQSGAISVSFPIFMLILGIGLTFGIGAASYISRLLGKKDKKNADKTASTAIFSTIITTIVFTIIALFYLEPILQLVGATKNILPYAKQYSTLILLGSIFPILSRTMNNIIRSEGNVKFNSIAVILGAILNLVLDPIFIFTFNMGIKGAAFATIISQAITTLILTLYFISGNSNLNVNFKNFKPSKVIYAQIIKIGFPTFLFQLLMCLSLGLINNKAGAYGNEAVAAIGISNRIFAIGMFVVFGFAKGFQPIAGYNFGAKNYSRLKESICFSIKITTIFASIFSLISILGSKFIISFFTDNSDIIAIGSRTLIGLNIAFPLFGIQMIFTSLFLAMGMGKQGILLSIARQGLFFYPLILFLPKIWGLNGIIFTQSIADFITSLVAFILGMCVLKHINKMKDNAKTKSNNIKNCNDSITTESVDINDASIKQNVGGKINV